MTGYREIEETDFVVLEDADEVGEIKEEVLKQDVTKNSVARKIFLRALTSISPKIFVVLAIVVWLIGWVRVIQPFCFGDEGTVTIIELGSTPDLILMEDRFAARSNFGRPRGHYFYHENRAHRGRHGVTKGRNGRKEDRSESSGSLNVDPSGLITRTAKSGLIYNDSGDLPLLPSSRTFNQIMMENPLVFVNYYSHWCQWSQQLRSTWTKLSTTVMESRLKNVRFLEINCEVHKELCQQQRVLAFPTLRFYNSGSYDRNYPDYRGAHSLERLQAFLERRLGGVIDDGTPEDKAAKKTEHDGVVFPPRVEKDMEEEVMELAQEGKYLNRFLPHYKYIAVYFSTTRSDYSLVLVWKELVRGRFRDVLFLDVDCYEESDLCQEHQVGSTSKIQLFKDGIAVKPHYLGPSSLLCLREYLLQMVASDYGPPFSQGSAFLGGGLINSQTNDKDLFKWNIEVEYAVRARNYKKLLEPSQDVVIVFTSSQCSKCASVRPIWHEFAHTIKQKHQRDLIVAEVDRFVSQCPESSLGFPFYRWYRKGQQVGSDASFGSDTSVANLMAMVALVLDLQKQYTEKE